MSILLHSIALFTLLCRMDEMNFPDQVDSDPLDSIPERFRDEAILQMVNENLEEEVSDYATGLGSEEEDSEELGVPQEQGPGEDEYGEPMMDMDDDSGGAETSLEDGEKLSYV